MDYLGEVECMDGRLGGEQCWETGSVQSIGFGPPAGVCSLVATYLRWAGRIGRHWLALQSLSD